MKKSRGIISLIVIAAVIAFLGFTTIHGLNDKGMGAARNINLGLNSGRRRQHYISGKRRHAVSGRYEGHCI